MWKRFPYRGKTGCFRGKHQPDDRPLYLPCHGRAQEQGQPGRRFRSTGTTAKLAGDGTCPNTSLLNDENKLNQYRSLLISYTLHRALWKILAGARVQKCFICTVLDANLVYFLRADDGDGLNVAPQCRETICYLLTTPASLASAPCLIYTYTPGEYNSSNIWIA